MWESWESWEFWSIFLSHAAECLVAHGVSGWTMTKKCRSFWDFGSDPKPSLWQKRGQRWHRCLICQRCHSHPHCFQRSKSQTGGHVMSGSQFFIAQECLAETTWSSPTSGSILVICQNPWWILTFLGPSRFDTAWKNARQNGKNWKNSQKVS